MKIAIIGTGRGYELAPIGKEGWQVWGLSGHWNSQAKLDRVFEIHHFDEIRSLQMPAEKVSWMKHKITDCHPTTEKFFPNAKVLDFESLLSKYGSYFTSSLSWMIAQAIEEGATEIGVYGVSMSSDEEYGHQKPGCSYLIGWARALGIKVHVQKDAELMSAPWIYGFHKTPDIMLSLKEKRAQVGQDIDRAEAKVFEAKAEYHFLKGVQEGFSYFEKNWCASSRPKSSL